jgi:hypothetical protein
VKELKIGDWVSTKDESFRSLNNIIGIIVYKNRTNYQICEPGKSLRLTYYEDELTVIPSRIVNSKLFKLVGLI